MNSDWPVIRLGDHVDSCLGKMLDKKKNKGIEQPYLGNSNVRWGHFDLSDLAQMKFEEREQERYSIKSGDLIICEGGEPGRCAIWGEQLPDMKIQKALHRVRPKASLNNYYLYYWFLYAGQRKSLEPYFTGTTIKHLTGVALSNLEMSLPSMEHQEFVARTLGILDKKIQLNQQINQTLEQMAQAIFKSWFVDFEPVKAKIAALEAGGSQDDALLAAMQAISGKDPQQLTQLHTEKPEHYTTLRATAELFPAAMQESELGEIPEGWDTCQIEEILDRLKPSKRYTKKQASLTGQIPIYEQGADILLGFHNDEPGFIATPDNPAFIFGDHTCVTRLSCQSFDISQNVIPLKGKSRPTMWVYYAVQGQQEFQEYRRHWSELIVKPVIYPTVDICERYSETITKLVCKKESLERENQSLAELRDTLLPKLLSGELAITDAE